MVKGSCNPAFERDGGGGCSSSVAARCCTARLGSARTEPVPRPGPAALAACPVAALLVGCGGAACRIYTAGSGAGDRPLVSSLLLGTFDRRAAGSQRRGRAQPASLPPAPGSRRSAGTAPRAPRLPLPLLPPAPRARRALDESRRGNSALERGPGERRGLCARAAGPARRGRAAEPGPNISSARSAPRAPAQLPGRDSQTVSKFTIRAHLHISGQSGIIAPSGLGPKALSGRRWFPAGRALQPHSSAARLPRPDPRGSPGHSGTRGVRPRAPPGLSGMALGGQRRGGERRVPGSAAWRRSALLSAAFIAGTKRGGAAPPARNSPSRVTCGPLHSPHKSSR